MATHKENHTPPASKIKSGFKSIFYNAANIAVQGYNIKGEVVYWNRFSEKLFGFTEKEVLGKTLKSFFVSESDENEFKRYIKKAIRQNKPSPKKEWAITTKTGEVRHVLCHIFPAVLTALPEEEPIAIAMNIDITDSKSAKDKTIEIIRQLERFSEISANILTIKDEEKLFDHVSQAVVEISDFGRVLISYFTDTPPHREIIGHRGIKKTDLERLKKAKIPREKYLKYFEKSIKIGNQSCYIPHSWKDILDKDAVAPGEKTYPKKEGRWNREDNLLVAMKDTKGKIIGIISVNDSKSGLIPTEETVRPLEIFANLISEIIQRHKLDKIISESEEKYRELVNNIKIGIFRATPDGKLLEFNPSVVEMFGYTSAKNFLKVKAPYLYKNPDDRLILMKELEENDHAKNKEFILKKKDGTSFWASLTSTAVRDSSGRIIYYDTVLEDISERKDLEEEVKRLSITDELTGVYNRRYFNQNLPNEIKTAERWRSALSLIMIDIDDFKQYNDKYLHLEGDEILKQTATVISHVIRKEMDWASRFGGDEFVIILPGLTAAQAAKVGERIRRIFQQLKFKPKDEVVQKTLSMGVACAHYSEVRPKRGDKTKRNQTNYEKVATELTILADKALFKAKKAGRNQLVISKEAMELSRVSK
ncbi:MAG: diguanylate cyclase [Candidatus Aminicenantes bacterium]|nr:diguanylate cyclase [Candidatus Aminicenantes bacterium]